MNNSTKKIAIIDIFCLEKEYLIRFLSNNYFEVWNIKKNKDELIDYNESLYKELEKINKDPLASRPKSSLKKMGELLYDWIFPPEYLDLREKISRIDSPLLLSTNIPEICWELLHDGDEFLGLKYPIGRYCKKVKAQPRIPVDEPERCLIIADPTEDLPATREESERLIQWLEANGMICDYLACSQATKKNILDKIRTQKYCMIHYSGHISRDRERNEDFLRLGEGDRLYATDIKNGLVKGASFVFLNGCQSAVPNKDLDRRDRSHSGSNGTVKDRASHDIQSMAIAFLSSGARIVIGTIVEVPAVGARVLAEGFYEGIFAGEPVGTALKRAKAKAKKRELGATWASYILYGDPCVRLIRKTMIRTVTGKTQKALKYAIPTLFIIGLILLLLQPRIRIDGLFKDFDNPLITTYADSINDTYNINGDINKIRINNNKQWLYIDLSVGGRFDYKNIFYHLFFGDPNVKNGFNFYGNSNVQYLYMIETSRNKNLVLYKYVGPSWVWLPISTLRFEYSRYQNEIEMRIPRSIINRLNDASLFFMVHTSDINAQDLDFAPDSYRQEGFVYEYRDTNPLAALVAFLGIIMAMYSILIMKNYIRKRIT